MSVDITDEKMCTINKSTLSLLTELTPHHNPSLIIPGNFTATLDIIIEDDCGKKYGFDCSAGGGDKTDLVLKSLLRGLVEHVAVLRPEGGYKQLVARSVNTFFSSVFIDL